jgi:hypothetical protein
VDFTNCFRREFDQGGCFGLRAELSILNYSVESEMLVKCTYLTNLTASLRTLIMWVPSVHVVCMGLQISPRLVKLIIEFQIQMMRLEIRY